VRVDDLLDRFDLDAQPQQQVAQPLRRRRREIDLRAGIARRVDVGDVLAGDLKTDRLRLQRITGQLERAKERHSAARR
jgi:hypothetical protein